MEKAIGKKFMEQTKYQHLALSDQQQGLAQPPLQQPLPAGAEVIDLPQPEDIPAIQTDFLAVIELRSSLRQYAVAPLSLLELSYLLWCTQGVKQMLGNKATLRNVPSAGARHALETYLLINRVEGLEPGLYRFLALEHQLVRLPAETGIAQRVMQACKEQAFVLSSAVTFLWTAVPYRMEWRYGERAYRYLHLDAGHVCQNLYLAAQIITCGACAIAAFDDDALNACLGVDGETEFAIYAATVGKR